MVAVLIIVSSRHGRMNLDSISKSLGRISRWNYDSKHGHNNCQSRESRQVRLPRDIVHVRYVVS